MHGERHHQRDDPRSWRHRRPTVRWWYAQQALDFVSGTGPYDPETGKLSARRFRADETVPDEYLRSSRQPAARLDRIASATVILLEEADFAGMNEEWPRWFPRTRRRGRVRSCRSASPGMRVSIAAIAESLTLLADALAAQRS